MRPRSIEEVVGGHLCCGCGACAYLEPETVTMVEITDQGRRPLIAEGRSASPESLTACPGAGLRHDDSLPAGSIPELSATWGPVLALWEGHATDEQVRWAGSSAGAATTLALHGLRSEGMQGVLHTGAREDVPYLNQTVFSTTREELVAAAGSRYSPASPCDGLDRIEQAGGRCVFIGKPCDVAATRMARRLRPALDANLGLTIAVFCAGTPSTRGTLEMMARMGVADPGRVTEVRYRGRGWPGPASVESADGTRAEMTYDESWGAILQKHRQWRCYVCADHTGEFADIAVGDPWYRAPDGVDPGRSLILARTERGRRFVERAIAAGVLEARPVTQDILPRSQPWLESTRGAVWGRILVSHLLRAFAPRYQNMPMFATWMRHLSLREKLSSTVGTGRRVFRKGLRQRALVRPGDSDGRLAAP